MSALLPFSHPLSVVQRSPMSGVFATDAYLESKEDFVLTVLGKWIANPGNAVSCETLEHLAALDPLFEFYLAYRAKVKSEKLRGLPLLVLYQTGEVSKAFDTL